MQKNLKPIIQLIISFSDITCLQHCATLCSVQLCALRFLLMLFSLLFGGRQKKLQHEMQLQISDIRANRKGMGNGNWQLARWDEKYI